MKGSLTDGVVQRATSRRVWLLVAICMVMLAPFVEAEDCNPLDYGCLIRELDAQTKELGAEVSNLGDTVLPAISQGAADQKEVFDGFQSDATTFVTDASRVLNEFKKSIDIISAESLTLTQDIVYRIEDGRKLADYLLDHERERYLEFTGGGGGCAAPCTQFHFPPALAVVCAAAGYPSSSYLSP